MIRTISVSQPFVAITIFAFFFPAFYNIVGTGGAIIVNFSLIVFCIFLLLMKAKARPYVSNNERALVRLFFILNFVFFIHILLSITIGGLFSNFNIILRDFFELHRPVFNFLVFLAALASTTLRRDDKSGVSIHRMMLFIFIGLSILGFIQAFRQSDLIISAFTKMDNVRTRRVSAPFMNPYDYAFVMSFFIYLFLADFIFRAKNYIFLFGIAIYLFIATQSRSMTVGLAVGLLAIFPFLMWLINRESLSRGRIGRPLINYLSLSLIGSLAFILLLSFLLENFRYLTSTFVELLMSGDLDAAGSSMSIRQEQLQLAFNLAKDNPLVFLFGNGPAKSSMEYVESMYTYFFFRYGVIGFIFYFVIPLCLGVTLLINILKTIGKENENYPFFLALLLWFLCIPICSIGNNLTEQVRVSFLYYGTLGIITKAYIDLRAISNRNIISMVELK